MMTSCRGRFPVTPWSSGLPERIYLAPATGRTFPSTARMAQTSPRVSVRRKDLRKYAEGGAQAKLISRHQSRLPRSRNRVCSPWRLHAMPAPPPPQVEPRKFELPDMPVHVDGDADAPAGRDAARYPASDRQAAATALVLGCRAAEAAESADSCPAISRRSWKLQSSTPSRAWKPPNQRTMVSPPTWRCKPPPVRYGHGCQRLPRQRPCLCACSSQRKNPIGPTSIDPFTGHPVHVMALSRPCAADRRAESPIHSRGQPARAIARRTAHCSESLARVTVTPAPGRGGAVDPARAMQSPEPDRARRTAAFASRRWTPVRHAEPARA